eukprot:gene25115-30146_t
MPQLTPADVHNVAFSKPPIGKRGYNEDEVDAFLDLVEQALSQLIEENADLRQRVGELDQELAAAKKSPAPAQQAAPVAAQPKPEPARVVEPPKPAPVAAPVPAAAAVAAPQSGDTHMQAAKVLGLAQEMADRLTNDAKTESEQLLGSARTNSEQLMSEARSKADGMIADARNKSEAMLTDAQTRSETQLRQAQEKADALKADAEKKHTEIMATINQQRSVLEGRIEQLKTFEREYRVRLKSYLESQLEELEQRGSAVPVDGGQDSYSPAPRRLSYRTGQRLIRAGRDVGSRGSWFRSPDRRPDHRVADLAGAVLLLVSALTSRKAVPSLDDPASGSGMSSPYGRVESSSNSSIDDAATANDDNQRNHGESPGCDPAITGELSEERFLSLQAPRTHSIEWHLGIQARIYGVQTGWYRGVGAQAPRRPRAESDWHEEIAMASNGYPKVDYGVPADTGVKFPELEQKVLKQWDDDDTFRASVSNRDGNEEFVFYDGPPFANGLPHYGHLLTGYVKDLVPRFQTMRGRKVERRFGWDCHGLPAELEAEKQLGIKDKAEIEVMGLAKFNEYCKASVLKYTDEWRDYVTRQARWVDFDNDYKTLDVDFMESVMWAFKELHDKGLIYQGFRVLPYSWYEQTPLSNQETRLDDAYKMRQDPAVTVDMPLVAPGSPLDGANAIIWTTTPWTLPSNLATAVHPEVDYVQVLGEDGKRYVLAEARVAHYARELGEDPEVVSRHKGAELVGLSYTPPFDFFLGHPNAHVVLSADYVTTDSGTGIVHLAPAFGEEDMDVATANGIEVVQPLDPGGKFTSMVPPYEGLMVFDANPVIIKDLKAAGKLLRHETIEHSYPHSWRSGQPLIYMAVPSWFVAVTKFRDRMVELNKDITWVPEHIRDGQFGKWLEGARDWNISRNRYWGSPIPVWVSDDPQYPRTDVYGSLDQLEADFGVRPTDLHRPMIDDLVRPNPDDPTGKSMMRRVPEVLDCWFESGSMPYAQVHYPFENREWFEGHFPGDFIVEYNGQTRGWFYTLHVLATALFDRPAFKTVAAHGIVLGDDGLKMS